MADEPKVARKRSVRKSSENSEVKSVPVPMFQAAPTAARTGSSTRDSARENAKSDSDSEKSNFRRRRRRGVRGKKRGRDFESDSTEVDSLDGASDSNNLNDADSSADSDKISSFAETTGGTGTHRRRRRRRSKGDAVTPGETVDEDGVLTVVKVREVKPKTKPAGRERGFVKRERRDRYERGFNRRDGGRDSGRDGGREYSRDFTRRRGMVITEAEFLSRRESVEREMLVRQTGDRTQIAIIEDGVMVEHYVNRNSNISYVGNVYLGKVQNVLPSMEAAFVDIGKGRNAVLYAGEVNWDESGLAEGKQRKIENVLKTGQSVLVQVTKDPIGQKGARLTSQISLPGRYLVFVPGGGMSGISRRLPEAERARLKNILKNMVIGEETVIVRTAAEGISETEIERDVKRLKAQWEDIEKKAKSGSTKAPAILYSEPDLTVRVIRDIFNEDFRKLIVQGSDAWDDIQNYISFIAPELSSRIEKYTESEDLFVKYRVDEQLAKAFDRKVYLPSGGSLVIDRTEAMIVIDVNTGKFIGKGGNLEETVTKNNLEAAEEIARQLRLRDLGGIIVIDFIDMILESNRDQVLRRLVECLGRDRTKHQVAEVTSLGLVQMTRKRVGQGLIEAFSTVCDSCGGRGIHIHTEPVRKQNLDKDLDRKYSRESSEETTQDDDLSDANDSNQLTQLSELQESNDVEDSSANSDESEQIAESEDIAEIAAPEVVVEPAKKRRRSVSTGVITGE
jgi:ribonuclease E